MVRGNGGEGVRVKGLVVVVVVVVVVHEASPIKLQCPEGLKIKEELRGRHHSVNLG